MASADRLDIYDKSTNRITKSYYYNDRSVKKYNAVILTSKLVIMNSDPHTDEGHYYLEEIRRELSTHARNKPSFGTQVEFESNVDFKKMWENIMKELQLKFVSTGGTIDYKFLSTKIIDTPDEIIRFRIWFDRKVISFWNKQNYIWNERFKPIIKKSIEEVGLKIENCSFQFSDTPRFSMVPYKKIETHGTSDVQVPDEDAEYRADAVYFSRFMEKKNQLAEIIKNMIKKEILNEGVDQLEYDGHKYEYDSPTDLKYSFLIVDDNLLYSTNIHGTEGHSGMGWNLGVINKLVKKTNTPEEFRSVLEDKLDEYKLAFVDINKINESNLELFHKTYQRGEAIHARVWVGPKIAAFRRYRNRIYPHLRLVEKMFSNLKLDIKKFSFEFGDTIRNNYVSYENFKTKTDVEDDFQPDADAEAVKNAMYFSRFGEDKKLIRPENKEIIKIEQLKKLIKNEIKKILQEKS